MYSLIVRCTHTVSYHAIAVLGLVILVLGPVSLFVAACTSVVIATRGSPGYNSAWDLTSRERGVYVRDEWIYVIMTFCLCAYQAYVLLMNLWIFFHCLFLNATSEPHSTSAVRADLIKRRSCRISGGFSCSFSSWQSPFSSSIRSFF